LGGELGVRQATQDVGHVEALAADDLEDDELEQSLAQGSELGFGGAVDGFRYLV
jgi:hypothetical protein